MLMITPEIITNFETHHVCDKDLAHKGTVEHQEIYNAIKIDPNLAKQNERTFQRAISILLQYLINN